MTSQRPARIRHKRLHASVALLAAVTVVSACGAPTARQSTTAGGAAPVAAPYVPCGNPSVKLEKINQDFLNELAAAGGPPLYKLSYEGARKVLDDLQSKPVNKLPADITERNLPVGPGGSVSIRIVRPSGVKGSLPGIIYTHGGGWVLGNAHTHDRLVRELANGARAAVVFVNYTPSPEARYPVAIEQAHAAAKWVAEHGNEINIDGSRLAIAGDSAGGGMAAAVTLLAKERGGPKFAHQALFYPVTDADFDTGSYKRFAENCFLTRPGMQWFWDAYTPNAADRKKSTAAPLRASVEELRGLPPALVITDSDVLLDEGTAYAEKLRAAGVPVTATHYGEVTHDFMMLNALANTKSARDAFALTNSTLREALYPGDQSAGK
ncbi:alpha/beta hydrolase [Streptomyces sp. NBC_01619]|uniref:alpha/beta hydrolase n=1 Tax=unclassified Streptomyces TaxID=2593676 RepID=UPI0022587B3B|nr:MULTISPECIES: alpha/beta hydrolase [unclassified Streptomyces]MCX4515601.1 alpha/beta hydrolase [Streptomyces sp. NBC_01619]